MGKDATHVMKVSRDCRATWDPDVLKETSVRAALLPAGCARIVAAAGRWACKGRRSGSGTADFFSQGGSIHVGASDTMAIWLARRLQPCARAALLPYCFLESSSISERACATLQKCWRRLPLCCSLFFDSAAAGPLQLSGNWL